MNQRRSDAAFTEYWSESGWVYGRINLSLTPFFFGFKICTFKCKLPFSESIALLQKYCSCWRINFFMNAVIFDLWICLLCQILLFHKNVLSLITKSLLHAILFFFFFFASLRYFSSWIYLYLFTTTTTTITLWRKKHTEVTDDKVPHPLT